MWVYDITTISSYSKLLRQVQYGWNKEHDRLPQLNLPLVFVEKSNLIFYYRKLAGNIPDSKTVKNLLAELDILGFSQIKLIMDRGFHSEYNINALFKEHLKFIIVVKMSLTLIRKELEPIYDQFRNFVHYSDKYELYYYTLQVEWLYSQCRPYKKEYLIEPRGIYIHYYYNFDQAAEDEKAFDRMLIALLYELESGQERPENEKPYKKHFEKKTIPKRGVKATFIEEADARQRFIQNLYFTGRA